MQASKRRHNERKTGVFSVGLVLKSSFNDTVIEDTLTLRKEKDLLA